MKGLLKPSNTLSDSLKEIDDLDKDDEGREKEKSFLRRDRDHGETRLASMGIGKGMGASGSSILDQSIIAAIRERLRQPGAAAPDFISLDGGSNHGAAEGLSDEKPEFRGRITMFGDKMEGGKKGVFEDVDERGIDSNFRKVVEDVDDDGRQGQGRENLGRIAVQERIVTSSNASVVLKQSVQQQKFAYPTVSMCAPVQSVPPPPSIGGSYGASHCFQSRRFVRN